VWRQVWSAWVFARSLWTRLGRGEASAYAAALTYNFLFALFPLALTMAAALPALRLGPGQQGLAAALSALVPPEVVRLVSTAHGPGAHRRAVAVSGGVGYLLGMSAAFRRLMEAFARARRAGTARPDGGAPVARPATPGGRTLWWTVGLSLLLSATLGLGLVALMLLLTISPRVLRALLPTALAPEVPAAVAALRWLILLAFALLMIALLYWIGPEGRRPFRPASPGALAAIGVWAVISYGFSAYLSRFNAYDALYGSMGAVILLLLYLYFLSYALLLGAQVDALLEGGGTGGLDADRSGGARQV
jgi:membrane protein